MNYNTSRKIKELYEFNKTIDRRNSNESIPQTLSILSSGGINSALVYTGTFSGYFVVDNLLILHPNITARVYAVIYVDYRDEYNIDLVQIKSDRAEVIRHTPGIYLEQLASTYEQIYDSYINIAQDGFVRIRL